MELLNIQINGHMILGILDTFHTFTGADKTKTTVFNYL